MKLLDLPVDIINLLPNYFNSIYDLYNVLLTCRTLYTAYRDTHVKLPPILPKLDGQPLFQPHPHLLLTIVASQVGDWAVSSPSNRYELYQSLLNGHYGLLSLAERVSFVTLSDLRDLHATKYSVLNPVIRLVDFEAGPAMVRHQEIDPAEYGLTICQRPDLAVMNYLIYCGLFHHYIDEILAFSEGTDSEKGDDENDRDGTVTTSMDGLTRLESKRLRSPPRSLEAGIRHRFIAYCLPDPSNHRNPNYNSLGKEGRLDESQLSDYFQMADCDTEHSRADALIKYYDTGILQAVSDVEGRPAHTANVWNSPISTAQLRKLLFFHVTGHLGYDSLRMLLPDGMTGGELEARLRHIKTKIQNLLEELIISWDEARYNPRVHNCGGHPSGRDWLDWHGMASDCGEGMLTNGSSDEDLQEETKKLESILESRIWTEQTGID
jgi:hypothetical protein